ncbi:DUF7577 domain-containing protein [Halosolutus gelatinilyticus]|uniref:DUF7577 domain-containing protein n=1 Tax=Halosolutus gelatinilyticus TaxID=2931975 RepID=UPI001FF6660E|nr:zinc ribbon domain-containing protein [Halosolutus gelatinilyticus]
MVTPGQVYVAIVVLLLFVALGVGIRVLKRIALDGLERRRKWRAEEIERYTEDEEYDRISSETLAKNSDGRTRLLCRRCGAENDPSFSYCRQCVEPL